LSDFTKTTITARLIELIGFVIGLFVIKIVQSYVTKLLSFHYKRTSHKPANNAKI